MKKDEGSITIDDKLTKIKDVIPFGRRLRMYNNDILVAIWVGPDGKDSDEYIVQFDQSDLLLPSSDYYKLGFAHPVMQTYYNMVVEVAAVLGADPARAREEMRRMVDFETALAEVKRRENGGHGTNQDVPFLQIMIPPQMRRNFSEIYKKMPLEELQVGGGFKVYNLW